MVWPASIVNSFNSVAHITTDESVYYGPFNKLLSYLFPWESDFEIVPQFKRPLNSQEIIDFVTVLVVNIARHPVFFVEVKPSGSLNLRSKREETDIQMRQRFLEFLDEPIIPVLYGISAMGPVLSVYRYDDTGLTPTRIPRDFRFVNDVAPMERWNYNVLEDAGEQRLRALVHEIKNMCAQVQGVYRYASCYEKYIDVMKWDDVVFLN
ncbi:hypothetical protein BU17DRAFT_53405 [Hysterangium stoloniferum]|nr:hypothetical protein BU17DRAFT_53405 [Hysterangium stoloniferum]